MAVPKLERSQKEADLAGLVNASGKRNDVIPAEPLTHSQSHLRRDVMLHSSVKRFERSQTLPDTVDDGPVAGKLVPRPITITSGECIECAAFCFSAMALI